MKRSERFLLFSLLGLGFLGLLVVASDLFLDKRALLLAEQDQLNTEWITIETRLEEKELWSIRSNWLESQQPVSTSPEKMDQAIFQEARATDAEGVIATSQTLLPTRNSTHYTQSGVSVIAEGNLPDVFRWLHRLEQPGDFRLIRNLKVTPAKENPEAVTANFEILRWYAPKEL